jgi:hypothetical protein
VLLLPLRGLSRRPMPLFWCDFVNFGADPSIYDVFERKLTNSHLFAANRVADHRA